MSAASASAPGLMPASSHRRRRGAELFLLVLAPGRRHRRLRRRRARRRGQVPPDIVAYGGVAGRRWSSGRPRRGPDASRRTPTRCCCPSSPRSTASAWRSSTASTWPTPAADAGARTTFAAPAADLDDPRRRAVRRHAASCCATTGCCSASPTPAGSPRSCCCCCRWSPALGAHDQRRPDLDPRRPVQLPARRGRQGAAGDRLRRLPGAAPRRAGARRPPVPPASTCPRGRDLGPILAMWLVSLGILVFQRDLGSSLLFFGLFLMMLYVATERPGWLVVGGVLFVVGAYAGYLGRSGTCSAASTSGCTRSTTPTPSLPARRGPVRHGLGRAARPRPRAGQPERDPVRRVRLHHRRRSARSSGSPA